MPLLMCIICIIMWLWFFLIYVCWLSGIIISWRCCDAKYIFFLNSHTLYDKCPTWKLPKINNLNRFKDYLVDLSNDDLALAVENIQYDISLVSLQIIKPFAILNLNMVMNILGYMAQLLHISGRKCTTKTR